LLGSLPRRHSPFAWDRPRQLNRLRVGPQRCQPYHQPSFHPSGPVSHSLSFFRKPCAALGFGPPSTEPSEIFLCKLERRLSAASVCTADKDSILFRQPCRKCRKMLVDGAERFIRAAGTEHKKQYRGEPTVWTSFRLGDSHRALNREPRDRRKA